MAKGRSLHIGLNRVDPAAYQGWRGDLRACEADAKCMMGIAKAQVEVQSECILTARATADEVFGGIARAASELRGGDLFVLSYSGHGGRINDPENPGKQVDTWALFDRMIISHELYRVWGQFAAGVRIFMLSDSCHSGTMAKLYVLKYMNEIKTAGDGKDAESDGRLMEQEGMAAIKAAGIDDATEIRAIPADVALQTYAASKPMYDKIAKDNPQNLRAVVASVLLISGCGDNQTSADGERNGLFTAALLSVWAGGGFAGNYPTFYKSISGLMPDTQTPNYFQVGAASDSWNKDKPFVP
jgi:metacaspase-1